MLSLPKDLLHLIEKREHTSERRKNDRREEDIGPLGAVLSAEDFEDVPEKDRRRSDRRYGKDRRGSLG
jgi:hypothetical protein